MKYWLWRRVHESFVLVWATAGVVLGCFAGVFLRVWWFSAPVWLLVAGGLIVICFWRSRFLMMGLAVVAGGILGAWRAAEMVGDFEYVE